MPGYADAFKASFTGEDDPVTFDNFAHAIEAFEAAVAAVPRFLQCWRISGDADFMLRCVAPSVDDMRRQLLQFAGLPNVRRIRSFPVLGVSKDAPLPIPAALVPSPAS